MRFQQEAEHSRYWIERLIIFFVVCLFSRAQAESVVHAPAGPIAGSSRTLRGGFIVNSYLAIPYGLYNVQHWRFQDPKPMPKWSQMYNATNPAEGCMWYDMWTDTVRGQEECLRMDVFTPQFSKQKSDDDAAVIVLLSEPWRQQLRSQDLTSLLAKNVIVVVVHYRIQVLGFLSTEDGVLPGNYGLLDVILALQWIQGNIPSFGGDRQRVTLFGEGEGATHAFHLLTSPRAKGLFSRVILANGNALTDLGFSDSSANQAFELASRVQCDGKPYAFNRFKVSSCFGRKSGEELVRDENTLQKKALNNRMKPVVDLQNRMDPLLPISDISSAKKIRLSGAIPMMIGLSSNSGLKHVLDHLLSAYAVENKNFEIKSFISGLFKDILASGKLAEAVATFYSHDNCSIREATQAATDAFYYSSVARIVEAYSKVALVYVFVFNYQSFATSSSSPLSMQCPQENKVDNATLHKIIQAGKRKNDIMYSLLDGGPQTLEDRIVSDLVTTLWTNFAKTGRATNEKDRFPDWTPATKDGAPFYDINVEPMLRQTRFRQKELSFWSALKNLKNVFIDAQSTPSTETKESVLPITECNKKSTNGYVITTWIFFILLLILAATAIYLAYPQLKDSGLFRQPLKSYCFPHLYQQQETEV